MINASYSGNYNCKLKKQSRQWELDLINSKLNSELSSGMLSIVQVIPRCVHALFVVPKDGGGGVWSLTVVSPEALR